MAKMTYLSSFIFIFFHLVNMTFLEHSRDSCKIPVLPLDFPQYYHFVPDLPHYFHGPFCEFLFLPLAFLNISTIPIFINNIPNNSDIKIILEHSLVLNFSPLSRNIRTYEIRAITSSPPLEHSSSNVQLIL